VTQALHLTGEGLDGLALEVHEVEQLVDLGGQHLHCLLVDLHPVGLLIGLGLRNGAGAAAPGVQHNCMFLSLIEEDILRGKGGVSNLLDKRDLLTNQICVCGGLLDVLGYARDESIAILKVRIKVCLVDNRTGLRLDAGLLVWQGELVQHLHIGQRVG